jgi:hypothetical protein
MFIAPFAITTRKQHVAMRDHLVLAQKAQESEEPNGGENGNGEDPSWRA